MEAEELIDKVDCERTDFIKKYFRAQQWRGRILFFADHDADHFYTGADSRC